MIGEMATGNSSIQQAQRISRSRIVLNLLGVPLFIAVFVFLPARTWAWEKGWLFVLSFLTSALLASLYIWRVNPELIAARINPHQGTKRWDQALLGFFLLTTLTICPVAALDDRRFHWFPLPWWVSLLGYVLILVGMVVLIWVQAVNQFFEPTVRIQTERDHKVIESGPYAVVRHPGYVAGSVLLSGVALSLGSLWALIPAGLSSVLLILRTQWEDQTLQAELAGYKQYAARVPYKWLPRVW